MTGRGGKGHILLVEDDVELLFVLAQILEHAGYRVSQAEHREAAEALLRAEPVDVVIADSALRGQNGEAIAVETKIPVILTSGHPESISRLRDGALPFLAKPFSGLELLMFVAQVLSLSRDSRQNRS